MSHYKEVLKYCDDIIKGKIKSGEYVKKSVQRFISDIKCEKQESFLYKLMTEKADEVIDFAESLNIPDMPGDDKHLVLLPWHKFIYYNIWGWVYKLDEDRRRFRSGYVEVARKNSKTTSILFPFILYDFLTTDSSESYFVSRDGAQSAKSFKELSYIIKADKELSKVVNETVSAITYEHSRVSFFSSESVGIDSYKNSLSIIDEFHAYDSDKIVTAFKYGGRSRKNNLVLIITSAGNNITGPCYEENKKCKNILNKINRDDTYFGIIYAYDEDDDWKDSKHFIKANPSLKVIIPEDILLNDLNDALITPSHQPDFISKTCGKWVNATSSWISINKWENNKNYVIDDLDLFNLDAYGGLDLSSVNDFTAYTLYFKLEDGKYLAKHHFYIPESTVRERFKSENINIYTWIERGFITVTPGDSIDYEFIYKDIEEDSNKYNIKEIAYDRWQSNFLINKLEADLPNIIYVKYEQSLKNMSPATKMFEKAILDGEIVDNNPVMLWMMSNVTIKVDANGNYKPLKENKKSSQRIDGVITSIMSHSLIREHSHEEHDHTLEDILSSL